MGKSTLIEEFARQTAEHFIVIEGLAPRKGMSDRKQRRKIGADVMDEVAEKVRRLKVAEGISIRTALVYDGRLSPQIEAEHGFDVLIPASRLLA